MTQTDPKKNIETFYPLSPLQQGMLFHSFFEPGTGVYVEQLSCLFRGALDEEAFIAAWQQVVARNPILRSAFLIQGVKEPVQVVQREVQLPVNRLDWTAISRSEQQARLEQFLDQDRRAGFEFTRAPLMRITLMRLGVEEVQFTWTYHHVLLDGWSVPMLFQELFALYDAYSRSRTLTLPLRRPFRDYIIWLKRQDMAAAEAFWRRTLEGFTAPTPIGIDRTAPADQKGVDGNEREVWLSEEMSSALRAVARTSGLTVNSVLQGAWALLLSRYSGEEDVVFGATVSGRPADLPDAETMLGMFINTLPMRVRVDRRMRIAAWLKEVQATFLEMRQYEYSPLVQIKKWSEVTHERPLFETILVFENLPMPTSAPSRDGQLEIEAVQSYNQTNYAINLVVGPAERVMLKLVYDPLRIRVEAIDRLLEHLRTIVEYIAVHPEEMVGAIPMLTAAEERQIVQEWNATAKPRQDLRPVHAIIEEQVRRTPMAPALAFDGQQLSYAEMNHRANQLARYLRRQGIGPEVLVGICMDRSFEMIIAMLAIIKAGGAYLPIDPEYPAERISYTISDSGIRLLLTRSVTAAILAQQTCRLLVIDKEWEHIAGESGDDLPQDVAPENLAYVIYTSGSTGKPKGTLLQHYGLTHFIQTVNETIPLDATDRVLQFASCSFDASVVEIFTALTSGALLCLVRRETVLSSVELAKALHEMEITTILFPPVMLSMLAGEEFPRLKYVSSGGEACPWDIYERWSAGRIFFNAYGPTEITVAATWNRLEARRDGTSYAPIGRPITNVQIYLLDKHLQPVPVGVPGELFIGGVSLSRGYLGRPDLTAARFVPHPFSQAAGARLYRSGDLARLLPDGEIDFIGRIDNQVKIHGHRIELGEIESQLRACDGVQEAVVVAREDAPGKKRLAAYLVASEGAMPDLADLREQLQRSLPVYMVPADFVLLDVIPLTRHGKIDFRALPAPGMGGTERSQEYVAPATDNELALAEIWSLVLNVERIGIHDNFFELGGDSILSMQVIARANRAGLRITPAQIFQNPTIHELALAARSAAFEEESGVVSGEVPLIPIQHWFFDQNTNYPHHWNTTMFLELLEKLDIHLLQQTLAQLVERHDVMRARFHRTETGWQQHIESSVPVPFTHVDLSGLRRRRVKKSIEAATASLQASLDVTDGPVMRMVYFTLEEGQHDRLFIVFHHLASDGVSWRIFVEDFQALYTALVRKQEPALLPKGASVKKWANRLMEHAQTMTVREELDYWLDLKQPKPLPLPRDYKSDFNTYGVMKYVAVGLNERETQNLLKNVPAAYQTQINDVLHTVLSRSIRRWNGSRTLLVQERRHGREDLFEDLDVSRTLGWFVTTFPIKLTLPDGDDIGIELASVKEQLLHLPNNGFGFGLLRYLCQDEQVREQMQSLPVPEVSFNYLGQFDTMNVDENSFFFTMATESVGAEQNWDSPRASLLDFVCIISGGEFQMRLYYSDRIHRRRTAAKLADIYMGELRSLIRSALSRQTALGPGETQSMAV